jgi:hypothetical protein
MAAFSPLRAGGWAFGEILTSAQMNQLNTDFPFAMNGRDGGSYTLSDNLGVQTAAGKTIGLNGLTLTSSASGGAAAFTGNVSAAGTASVTSLVASFVIQGDTVNANSVNIVNAASIGGALGVGGALTLIGAATVGGFLAANAGLQVGGSYGVSVLGPFAATGSASAGGGFSTRVAIGNDTAGSHPYRATLYDYVIGNANTAPRNYTIDDTGLTAFETRAMWFINYGPNIMQVTLPSPASPYGISGASVGPYGIGGTTSGVSIVAMLFLRISGKWAQSLIIRA